MEFPIFEISVVKVSVLVQVFSVDLSTVDKVASEIRAFLVVFGIEGASAMEKAILKFSVIPNLRRN